MGRPALKLGGRYERFTRRGPQASAIANRLCGRGDPLGANRVSVAKHGVGVVEFVTRIYPPFATDLVRDAKEALSLKVRLRIILIGLDGAPVLPFTGVGPDLRRALAVARNSL